ncbi:hypothetical protein DV515_00015313 [Chloebia gouldiae]|uniref:Nuclear-interacting partner of ALK/Rsm1-like C-terminal domain-containing protein n=1 Tax=Chloebia gouldiae TaxID=44316 RepID=A0A3L8RW35_CHLGU|nr:hypothetical protein DV515_00015313 [Chloebia gouldiae]
MLRCSSCQAYLCMSLQLAFDLSSCEQAFRDAGFGDLRDFGDFGMQRFPGATEVGVSGKAAQGKCGFRQCEVKLRAVQPPASGSILGNPGKASQGNAATLGASSPGWLFLAIPEEVAVQGSIPEFFPADKERCEELRKALSTAHEKFCFWPDSPCPDRFAKLLVDEPRVLLQDFLDRFQSLCQLELQLPSLKPEDLKNMSLTEERITRLLQLIGEELEHRGTEGEKPPGKFSTEILQVHVPACILALCGWTCSASSGSVKLSVISCSRCMRKVGLWAFQQLACAAAPEDCCGGGSSAAALPTSPRRMLTRSQDPAAEQQHEKSPSPAVARPRGWDSPSSMDRGELDAISPALRSRPVTRSMGQGDNMEVPSSPVRRAKRARLCSSSSSVSQPSGQGGIQGFGVVPVAPSGRKEGFSESLNHPIVVSLLCRLLASQDTSLRSFFHPSSQHRDWCPWVSTGEGEESLEDAASQTEKEPGKAEPGWEVVLKRLLGIQKCDTAPETEPVSLSEKSCKVFRIFRQWESMNSS